MTDEELETIRRRAVEAAKFVHDTVGTQVLSQDVPRLVEEIRGLRGTTPSSPPSARPKLAAHPEDTCARCEGPNVSWVAPSPLWNAVMRRNNINEVDLYGGIVCPTCFTVLAEHAGIAARWVLRARDVKVELQVTTPSGRVWDDVTMLWVEEPT